MYWEAVILSLEVDLAGEWAHVFLFGYANVAQGTWRVPLKDCRLTNRPNPLPLHYFNRIMAMSPLNAWGLYWHPSYDDVTQQQPPIVPVPPAMSTAPIANVEDVSQSASSSASSDTVPANDNLPPPSSAGPSTRTNPPSKEMVEAREALRKELSERFVFP